MKTIKVKIYGKVQNVSFRQMIYREAALLGLRGYMCNDSNIIFIAHAVFQGDERKIKMMFDFIKSNPGRARIDDIKIEEIKPQQFSGFSIKQEVQL